MVLLAGGVIAYVSYSRSAQMLERATEDLLGRISQQTVSEIVGLFAPVETLTGLLAFHQTARAQSLEERLGDLSFFRAILQGSDAVTSFYIGYEDGDFFLVRRLKDDADRKLVAAPPAAALR